MGRNLFADSIESISKPKGRNLFSKESQKESF